MNDIIRRESRPIPAIEHAKIVQIRFDDAWELVAELRTGSRIFASDEDMGKTLGETSWILGVQAFILRGSRKASAHDDQDDQPRFLKHVAFICWNSIISFLNFYSFCSTLPTLNPNLLPDIRSLVQDAFFAKFSDLCWNLSSSKICQRLCAGPPI